MTSITNKRACGKRLRVVVIGYKRTPTIPMSIPVAAVDLGIAAVQGLLSELTATASNFDLNKIGALINGEVVQTPFTSNSAAFIARGARLPSAHTLTEHQQCASSLAAAEKAFQLIESGHEDLIVVTGIESMQNTPYLVEPEARYSWLNRKIRAKASNKKSLLGSLFANFGFGKA